MKKSLFVLGVAVAALASCTNEEVTEVAQNRVIGFNSFVNNNTKAVTVVNSLANSEFYVFGMYDADQTTWGKTVFSNRSVYPLCMPQKNEFFRKTIYRAISQLHTQ